MNALVEKLKSIVRDTNATDIRAAFAADPQRFSRYSLTLGDFLFDYSKCAVNDAVLDGLEALAKDAGVEKKRDAMFSGEIINITEERAVLHTALRNRAVQLVGLKNLGELSGIHPARPDADYRPGERVGIFTLFENTPDEVLLGDHDKHLDVVVSVHCTRPADQPVRVTVTTVVHTKNRLGRLYMLPVKPMHKLIAPSVLRSIGA